MCLEELDGRVHVHLTGGDGPVEVATELFYGLEGADWLEASFIGLASGGMAGRGALGETGVKVECPGVL